MDHGEEFRRIKDKMDKLSNLEFFKLVVADRDAASAESRFLYPPAIAKTLGFKLIEVGLGTATIELRTDTEKHANPMGTIHGGLSEVREHQEDSRFANDRNRERVR